jgi:hypothetical protein
MQQIQISFDKRRANISSIKANNLSVTKKVSKHHSYNRILKIGLFYLAITSYSAPVKNLEIMQNYKKCNLNLNNYDLQIQNNTRYPLDNSQYSAIRESACQHGFSEQLLLIENFIKTAEIIKILDIKESNVKAGQHASKVYLVEFDSNFKGIFKPDIGKFGSYKNEIAAWEIDKLMNLGGEVPPTVERTVDIDGIPTVGSMQLFVDNSSTLKNNEFNSKKIPPKIKVLDLVIGNGDRHHHNMLQSFTNNTENFFAIDNAKSFFPYDKGFDYNSIVLKEFKIFPERFTLDEKTMDHIKNITLPNFQKTLNGLVNDEGIFSAFQRLEIFRKSYLA